MSNIKLKINSVIKFGPTTIRYLKKMGTKPKQFEMSTNSSKELKYASFFTCSQGFSAISTVS